MTLNFDEAKKLIRTLVRSIDKKADFTATLQEGDRPGVAVTISLRKDKATIVIPAADLESAVQDAIHRSQLRTTLKQAIHRMTFRPAQIASTKMVRGTVVDGGFFRSPQGGSRGGRR
jgi:hypothetical protein